MGINKLTDSRVVGKQVQTYPLSCWAISILPPDLPTSLKAKAGQVIVVLPDVKVPVVLKGTSDPETSPVETQAPFSSVAGDTFV